MFELAIRISPPASIGPSRVSFAWPSAAEALRPAEVDGDADGVTLSPSGAAAWWRAGRTAPQFSVRLRFATGQEANAASAAAPVVDTVAGRRPLPRSRYRTSIVEIDA